MKIGLTGKRAIVTGGSRGIGYAIADALAAEGMAVSVCARGQQGLDAASKNLSRHGGNVHSLAADVASKEGIEGYMDAAITALGGVDVLVNNTSAFGGSEDEAGWDSSLNVDVMALVRASWKARASMAAQRTAAEAKTGTTRKATCETNECEEKFCTYCL